MAVAAPLPIPGLSKTPTIENLMRSREIYNKLPDLYHQPEPTQAQIDELAAIFIRNDAQKVFGIHLAHGHFHSSENTVVLGTNDRGDPDMRWARATDINKIPLGDIHGHVFVLTKHGFHPYEYQTGPMPDLSGVNDAFLPELISYLNKYNLAEFIGLQVLGDEYDTQLVELDLPPEGTIMLDKAKVVKGASTQQTGWKFYRDENGNPRVCKYNETHGRTAERHEVYNEGKPLKICTDFEELRSTLRLYSVIY